MVENGHWKSDTFLSQRVEKLDALYSTFGVGIHPGHDVVGPDVEGWLVRRVAQVIDEPLQVPAVAGIHSWHAMLLAPGEESVEQDGEGRAVGLGVPLRRLGHQRVVAAERLVLVRSEIVPLASDGDEECLAVFPPPRFGGACHGQNPPAGAMLMHHTASFRVCPPFRLAATGRAGLLILYRNSVPPRAIRPKSLHLAGLEPATFGSVDRCSIQLSYRCKRLPNKGLQRLSDLPLF